MKRTIRVAEKAGYCFGVKRALEMANEYLALPGQKVYSLGPIIHNPQVVEDFRSKGLIPVESLENVAEGVLVIRSHGVEREILELARAKNLIVVDATCPFVKNAQKLAHQLSEEGYQLLIVGKASHPEIRGILSYAGNDPIVVGTVAELEDRTIGPRMGIIAQTTQTRNNFIDVVTAVLPATYECRVYNTICNATSARQTAAVELAGTVDVMLVVGGKNSANTARLAELCRRNGTPTYHIESNKEITPDMIHEKERIGITAGASTPVSHIEAVVRTLEEFTNETGRPNNPT